MQKNKKKTYLISGRCWKIFNAEKKYEHEQAKCINEIKSNGWQYLSEVSTNNLCQCETAWRQFALEFSIFFFSFFVSITMQILRIISIRNLIRFSILRNSLFSKWKSILLIHKSVWMFNDIFYLKIIYKKE